LALAQAGTPATRLRPLRPRHQAGPPMGHAGNTSVRPVAAVRRADGARHRHVVLALETRDRNYQTPAANKKTPLRAFFILGRVSGSGSALVHGRHIPRRGAAEQLARATDLVVR